MLKILLIDDEERATDSMHRMIEKFIPDVKELKSCNDARKAAMIIHHFNPNLVFLDIRMPHLTGFDLLEQLPNKNFKVIFTTAYDKYAIQAIRFSAFDYLLKPIDSEELINAINRFKATVSADSMQNELFKNLSENMQLEDNTQFRLALPTREGIFFLMPAEIIRCEAAGNYTKFFITDDRRHLTSRTLGEYDDLLSPYHFIRTHKSHLVNKAFISYVDHGGFVILKDNTRVEVSRRRKEEVIGLLKSD